MATAAPPPMLGDTYSPEQSVPAIVRHVEREGWPIRLDSPDVLTDLARIVARAVFPHSPYRSGGCSARFDLGHFPAVSCIVSRPALGFGTSSAVLLKLTGCRSARADFTGRRGFSPCGVWEDGSVRALVIGRAA